MDVSTLTSSCACGIREAIGAIVQETAETQKDRKQVPDSESPIEFARIREWQNIFDLLVAHNVHTYPDVQSTERLEADLAQWERHAMLLIVPEAASLFTE
jgi:hypothetical protein